MFRVICDGFGPMVVVANLNQHGNSFGCIDGIGRQVFLYVGTSSKVGLEKESMIRLVHV